MLYYLTAEDLDVPAAVAAAAACPLVESFGLQQFQDHPGDDITCGDMGLLAVSDIARICIEVEGGRCRGFSLMQQQPMQTGSIDTSSNSSSSSNSTVTSGTSYCLKSSVAGLTWQRGTFMAAACQGTYVRTCE
jgi:hypothetical protein